MNPDMSESKVVVITGAGRGIGAATAKLFAEHGYSVCINYKNNAAAANEVAEIINTSGGSCITLRADVSEENGVAKLFEAVDKNFGRLDVLVNNVGIIKPQCLLVDMSQERISDVFKTNVISFFLCSREAIRRMSKKRGGNGGTIVNVSSGASKSGSPDEYIDYAASKGAIDTLTRGLSVEVAPDGIRVNGVRPGMVYTDIHSDGGEPERVNRLKSAVPLQRGGHPGEIAEAIYWLASEKSSYATGSILDVTGGL